MFIVSYFTGMDLDFFCIPIGIIGISYSYILEVSM